MEMVLRKIKSVPEMPLACVIKMMALAILLLLVIATPALGASPPQDRTISVLYAGSLATVMEKGIGPAFAKTGYTYQGEAQGSLGAAQLIRGHLRTPDVFISADPLVNTNLLMGPQNGNAVKWFAIVASSQLVLAYNPKSKFAKKFEEAAANKVPWYEVLATPGLRFGRGDPTIDPKGYRTLFMFNLAGRYYHRNDIPKLLGEPLNSAQVFPEVVLLARVESGQFDAGIFLQTRNYRPATAVHQPSIRDQSQRSAFFQSICAGNLHHIFRTSDFRGADPLHGDHSGIGSPPRSCSGFRAVSAHIRQTAAGVWPGRGGA